MPATNNAVNVMPADDLAALDAALADFDLDDDGDGAIVEPDMEIELEAETVEIAELTLADVEAAATAEIADEETLADLDIKLEMQESYQDQTATGSPEDLTNEAPAVVAKPAKVAKPPRATKTGGVTRVPRDISTVAAEFFVTAGDPATMSDDEKAAAKADTMALKPGQVKIAEKFENLFTALSVNKAPSKFTMIAFDALQQGTLTSTELVGAYKASGLGEGTARSQAGQMMNLFAAVRIADRSGQTLTLRADSLLAQRIRNLPAAAAA